MGLGAYSDLAAYKKFFLEGWMRIWAGGLIELSAHNWLFKVVSNSE